MKAQYGILRFKKYKGPAISPIEAHNERTKEQYASNPDIDTSRSRYNFHLVQPQGKYRAEADHQITAANCRVRKDSVRVVEALITASPEFFKDKSRSEIKAYFEYALKFLEGKQRPDTFLSAVVHMDEKTPHLHLCFVPLTADGRLSAKEIIGNRKNLVKWQDEFWQHIHPLVVLIRARVFFAAARMLFCIMFFLLLPAGGFLGMLSVAYQKAIAGRNGNKPQVIEFAGTASILCFHI